MASRLSVVDEFHAMSATELRDFWRREFGSEPPGTLSRDFLRLEAAWRIQTETHGGLSPRTQRRLRDLLAIENGKPYSPPVRRLRAGTSLVRDWRGVKHTVDVVEDGYVHTGKHYKTLSAVARAIAGSQWSGPAFFGLKGQSASEATR